jgi:hypothetical protein
MRFPRQPRSVLRSRFIRFPIVQCLAGALVCGALLAASGTARAEDAPVIYRWIDAQGIAHYTANLDRVPRAVRGRLEVVDPAGTAPTPAADPGWVARDAAPAAGSGTTERGEARVEPGARSPWSESSASSGSTTSTASTGSAGSTGSTGSTGSAGSSARGSGSPSASGADGASLDTRIASLADAVERDEEALKTMLSEAPTEGAPALRERPDFRTIAQRLPRLQSDLRSLRDQRDRLDGR